MIFLGLGFLICIMMEVVLSEDCPGELGVPSNSKSMILSSRDLQ